MDHMGPSSVDQEGGKYYMLPGLMLWTPFSGVQSEIVRDGAHMMTINGLAGRPVRAPVTSESDIFPPLLALDLKAVYRPE